MQPTVQMSQRNHEMHVLDIRPTDASRQLADQISRGLDAPFNKKTLPTVILYDEVGLLLYDKFSAEAPEYYHFGAELEILKGHADEIVRKMHKHTGNTTVPGEAVIELGAGSLRKTVHFLRALSDIVPTSSPVPPVTFYALDLDGNELRRALSEVHNSDIGPSLSGKVETRGLWGTYENGFEFIKAGRLGSSRKVNGSSLSQANSGADITSTTSLGQPPTHFLFLGGSIGNFYRGDDSQLLRSLPLQPGDTLLLGLTHTIEQDDDPAHTYKDTNGYCQAFTMNGLNAAGNILGSPGLFDQNNWEFTNIHSEEKCRFEGFYKCLRSHEIYIGAYNQTVQFLEGELLQISVSANYSESDTYRLFNDGQLRPIQRWVDSSHRHSLWLLERSTTAVEHNPSA
ncbi:histidine-specific methyltransferase [Scleroderma yunnanense]